MAHRFRLVSMLAAGWLAAGPFTVRAQGQEADAPAAGGTAPAHVLDRVVTIGASATDGFGVEMIVGKSDDGTRYDVEKVDLGALFDAAIARPHQRVRNYSNLAFFGNPLTIGPRMVVGASKIEPTLVVGVDFLFWFGYGLAGADRRLIDDDKADRLALLEEGLKLLDRFECPILVGDFPDMSAAVGGMLMAQQMPTRESLASLNARLREWAQDKPNVRVLPLADLIAKMNTGEPFTIGEVSWYGDAADALIQPDALHPTLDGMMALVHLVAHELVQHTAGEETSTDASDASAARMEDFDFDADAWRSRLVGRLREK